MAFNLNLLRSNVQKNTDALRQGARKLFFGGGVLGALKRPESSTSQLGSGGSWGRPATSMATSSQTQPKASPTSVGIPNSGGSFGISKLRPSPQPSQAPTPTLPRTQAQTSISSPSIPSGGGFSSSDPAVQARLAEMNAQTYARSYQPVAPPTSNIPSPITPGASTIKTASVPSQNSGLSEAQRQLLALYNPSKEEKTLQDELATLRGNAQLGLSGLEGQGRGIPLELIRGQQGKLEEQAAIKEGTLMERLAAATAQRQAALQASTANLGFIQQQEADRKAAEAAQAPQAPFEFNGNLVRFNPQTGQIETVAQGAQKAESNLMNVGGNLYDPTTGQWIMPPESGGSGDYSNLQKVGDSIYDAATGQWITNPNASTGANMSAAVKTDLANTQTLIDLINKIPQTGGLAGVGMIQGLQPNFLASQAGQDTRFTLNNITSAIAKLRGGTSFTESERKLLESYTPKVTDTDQVIQNKLRNLSSFLQTSMSNIQQQFGGVNQQNDPRIQQLQNAGFSSQEIQEYLGFNSVPSMTQNGSAQAIANAIKKVESGGNYNARGGSGESGAYQYMPATWSQWAGQYLGNANAPMTPENQDRVAISRIQDWIDQGYNPQQIALMWNGGTPVVKKGINKYGVAYDSGAYANKVLNAMG